MKKLFIKDVIKEIDGELLCGNENSSFNSVSRDSRNVDKNCLFFFLVGEVQDGHKFLKDVLDSGVRNLVVSEKNCINEIDKSLVDYNRINIIYVNNTTVALQKLSKYYLKILNPKVIGITGSVGKTTTKDILFHILNSKYEAGKTMGNYNNEIGLPLTILSLDENVEMAILEMGAGEKGDISFLAELARPEIAIITNIGLSHLETMGSQENIFDEKMKITSYFGENDTLIFIPDGKFLLEEKRNFNSIPVKAEVGNERDLVIKNIKNHGEKGTEFFIEYMGEREKFSLEVLGKHNALNCGLAVAAAIKCGVNLKEASAAIKGAEITKGRQTIKEKDGYKIIDDTYNASPTSMKAALDLLESFDGKRKIAILGDMYELGNVSETSHYEIGKYAISKNFDVLISVGDNARNIYRGAHDYKKDIDETITKIIHYNNREIALENVKSLVQKGDVLLFKASRGMKLEEIIEKL